MEDEKSISAIIAMIMVLSMGMVSVNAAESQPSLPLCPRCGSIMHPGTTYEEWKIIGSRKCTHGYKYGADEIIERDVVTITKCTNINCGLSYPPINSRETNTRCHGYN